MNDDFDGDGDEDLFVGGRSVPYHYGATPVSYLYRNDGNGRFSDVTRSVSPAIAAVGMVTGAVWADVAGNKSKELIIVEEWRSPRIFRYDKNKDKLEELSF